MRSLINIVFVLIILCGLSSCFEYQSHLNITGDGYLSSNSNLGAAKDHISAQGEQIYDRLFVDQTERSLYVSRYNLTRPTAEGGRVYSISFLLPDGKVHYMRVSSQSTMSTIGWVDRNSKGIETKYRASTEGNLTEGILDRNGERHTNIMAETTARGDITYVSGLKSNATYTGETDADKLLNSLESVNLYSEIARVQIFRPKTEFNFDGERFTVADNVSETSSMKNTDVIVNKDTSISSASDNDPVLEEAKDTGVSEKRIIPLARGNMALVKQKPGINRLIVQIASDPSEGNLETNVNFTIKLTRYGNEKVNDVSVNVMLDPGMDYTDSERGVYNGVSRTIDWANLGTLDDLHFKAKVNKNASGRSTLKTSVQLFRIATNGTRAKLDEDASIFTIKQASLDVIKSSNYLAVTTNSEVTYSLEVKNTGEVEAQNVFVKDELPYGMVLLSSDPKADSDGSSGYVIWSDIGPISPGESKNLAYLAKVEGSMNDGQLLVSSVRVDAQTSSGEPPLRITNTTQVTFSNVSSAMIIDGRLIIKPKSEALLPNTPVEEAAIPVTNDSMKILRTMSISPTNRPMDISVELTASPIEVNSGSKVTFEIKINNTGSTNLTEVFLQNHLHKGMNYSEEFSLDPSSKDEKNGNLIWQNIGPIDIDGIRSLTFGAKVSGSNIDGQELKNDLIVLAKDINGTTISKNASAKVKYSTVSTTSKIGKIVVVKSKQKTFAEREPIARETIHLGRTLIWDRQAYGGWKVIRVGDEYFVRNNAETDKAKSRIWYNPPGIKP